MRFGFCEDEHMQTNPSGVAAIVVLAGIGACGGLSSRAQTATVHSAGTDAEVPGMPREATYVQVYATPDGETHVKDVHVPLAAAVTAPPAQPIAQSGVQPATTIRHAAFPPRWGVSDRDRNVFHNASERRFISFRSGVAWIRTSDGDTRRFQAGDLLEVLDIAPSKGHITWVGDQPAIVLFSNHQ
jgi:hypothetical protein